MKQVFKSLVLVASVATAFISCQKEQNFLNEKETVKLTVHANAENLNGDTKTYINGKQVLWGTGEYMTAALVSGGDFATYNSNKESADIWNGESGAMFEFDVELSAGVVTYGGIYPASAVVADNNKNPQSFKVELGAVQKATASSYDPAAYIMIAKPETFTEATTEWEASFRRATALNKITLTGLTEEISAVEITAPSTSVLAGRRYFNLTTGESGEVYTNKSNFITVNYDSPLTEDNKDVWFTSWGTTIAGGETLKIKATSSTHTYTRTITAKSSGISFKEGFLNTLTVNMAADDVVIEEISDYSGEYLIVSGKYLLTDYNESEYYNRVEAAGTELSDFWGIPNVEDYVWTVAKLADGSYSFCNAGSDKYLALNASSNKAHVSEETNEYTAMTITKEDDASLTIYSKAFSGRHLRYNTSSPRFAFYGSGSTTGTIATLLAYTSDPRTPFDAVSGFAWDSSSKTLSWTAVEGADNGYEYTTDDGATLTAVDAITIDCSSWSNGDYSVKVRVVGTDARKTSEWSEAYEFTISGGVAAKYYRKVTEELADWTGTYLIVAGTSAANGTISSSWLKCITVTTDSENKILSEDKTDAVAVSIEETETDGIYTIQFANEKYLGTTNSNSGIKVADSAGDDFKWTFSFSEELVKITSTVKDGRHLRLNGDSGFRTYTNTTGTQATLYKLDEAAVISLAVSGTPKKTSYKAGDEFEITGLVATATFSDASEKNVTEEGVKWTVEPTPLTAGTTSVSVVATYKNVSSTAYVVNNLTVTEPAELTSISVKTAPEKVVYKEGEKFDPAGLVITRNYSDETNDDYAYADHEDDFSFSPALTTALTISNTSVTITYGGKSVSQNITVNDTSLKTMDEIFAAATAAGSTAKDAKVKFDNWVVSGVKSTSNAYLTDNNGKGLMIYASGHGFAVGDILSGTVNCKVLLYNGAAELTSLTSTTVGLSVTKGGTITPATISIANLSGVNNGAVITFESLQYNGSAFSDGTNTITPYNTFNITMPTLTSGRNYSVTGVYIQYNSSKQIAPRTAEDFVEIAAPKYAVSIAEGITNGTVSVDFSEATAGQTVTITATPSTGYKVKSVTAKKTASGDAITVTNNKFAMPAEAVTVSAEFEETGSDEPLVLTFDLSSNPGGWPTTNSTTLTGYTYTLNDTDYTFELKNVKCNSGYLMLTYTAVLGLPAIEGKTLTKVVAKNSGGCSTTTKVGISSSSSSASYISGGAIQTWSTTSSSYTYTLTGTSDNTVYYLYVTNKNAQITELTLTYE